MNTWPCFLQYLATLGFNSDQNGTKTQCKFSARWGRGAGQHSVLWQYGVCSGKIDHRDFSCHALLRQLGRAEKSLSI